MSVKSFIRQLFGAEQRFSELEKLVLCCVRDQLDDRVRTVWDKQIAAINKFQRLPEGVEVNFYTMKDGRPFFSESLSFPNKTSELLVANVRVELPNLGRLTAKVWSVNGYLFSIEYAGSVSYFDEAAGMDPRPEFCVRCEMVSDLALETM